MPLCDFKKESLLNFLGFSVMSEKNYFSEEKVPSIMKETRLQEYRHKIIKPQIKLVAVRLKKRLRFSRIKKYLMIYCTFGS